MARCRIFHGVLFALLLAISSIGCSTRGDRPVPVRGTVLYRGAPVTGGVIVFVPDASRGSSGPLARGEILSDGSYSLLTGDVRGAAGGWYRVTVASVQVPGKSDQAGTPRSLLPDKYRDPEISGLCCEICAGRANRINFDLE